MLAMPRLCHVHQPFPAFHPGPVSRSVGTSPSGPLLPHDVERRHGVGGRESRARGAKHLTMDCPP